MLRLPHSILATLGACALWFTQGTSFAESSLEYRVKAAFLFNFARYTQWADTRFSGPASPIDLCVLDPDPFAGSLHATVEGKQVQGRALEVHGLSRLSNAQDCELLYLDTLEPGQTPVLAPLIQAGTLIVSSDLEVLNHGGVIAFVLEDTKLRFRINLDAAKSASVEISSKLLRVAQEVRGSGGRS